MLIAFASPPSPFPGRTGRHSSFTAWTTRVSNPVRYPRFRASASVRRRYAAFAIGVLRDIYAFHRYTAHSAYFSPSLVRQFQRLAGVEPRAFTADFPDRLRTLLNPINPDNARILRITAAAGTELADAFSSGTLTTPHVAPFVPRQRSLRRLAPSSFTRLGWFRLPPIDQYSSLLPPVGVWSVSQYQCGDLPLRTPTHRRLGGPLPRLLPNAPHAHPPPVILSSPRDAPKGYTRD